LGGLGIFTCEKTPVYLINRGHFLFTVDYYLQESNPGCWDGNLASETLVDHPDSLMRAL